MPERNAGPRLDLGCGTNKASGAIGVDRVLLEGVDVVANFNRDPLPFRDSVFEFVRMDHVIEHALDPVVLLEQVHRVLRPGGEVSIRTPHYTSPYSWNDPTHRWHFSTDSFRYYDPEDHFRYYTKARFVTVRLRVRMPSLWRLVGFEALLNRSLARRRKTLQRFWEHYLSFVLRAREMEVRLRAVK